MAGTVRIKNIITFALASVLFVACGCGRKPQTRTVQVVSWGGEFQKDLIENWVLPSANTCGVTIETSPWNGDYSALTARITKGINTWDLVHVEAHYTKVSDADSIFEAFPSRNIAALDTVLREVNAVPVLEYGYVLAYRSDLLRSSRPLDWHDFWDTKSLPGKRGLRNFPIGNIEIALLSLGRDVNKDLYNQDLSRDQVERQVSDALNQLDKIKSQVVWWKSGDQLQRDIESGDTPLSAAWSGRVWSAHKNICANRKSEDCPLHVNPETALVSTDWWVIPKGAKNKEQANKLLECMYSPTSLDGAAAFSTRQGYLVPAAGIEDKVRDPLAKYYLGLGASSGKPGRRIQEQFWGRHFEWISSRWKAWQEQ